MVPNTPEPNFLLSVCVGVALLHLQSEGQLSLRPVVQQGAKGVICDTFPSLPPTRTPPSLRTL